MNKIVAAVSIAAATPTIAPSFAASLPQSHPDAELLSLADEYVLAEQRWCDLNVAVDRLAFDDHRARMPKVLEWRDEDLELGLPQFQYVDEVRNAWDCPANVNRLREERWPVTARSGADDDLTLRFLLLTPSPQALARADEIIAAFDAWNAKRYPRGLKKLERERDRAFEVYASIEERIAATPASTADGIMTKIRCAQAYSKARNVADISLDCGSCGERMAESIFRDIERLATG